MCTVLLLLCYNASFHKSETLREALALAGIGLLFLSPYSPDLNPIEALWSWLKGWIRGLNESLLHISQALTKVFGSILT
jgi:transposase